MRSLLAHLAPRVGLSALAALAIGVAAWQFSAPAAPRVWKQGYVYFVEAEGFVYSFDAAWRVESLRSSADPARPVAARPGEDSSREARLREALLLNLGLPSLDRIPVEGAGEMKALRALGYI